jgi:hypothetical protein
MFLFTVSGGRYNLRHSWEDCIAVPTLGEDCIAVLRTQGPGSLA